MLEDDVSSPAGRARSGLAGRAAPWLLLLFATAGAWSLRLDAVTFDETAHLAAGIASLERHDFRLNPEHPPLAKAWAALPVVLAGRGDLPYDDPAWAAGDQWRFGWIALNGAPDAVPRRDPRRLLRPARLATLAVGVALGVLVFVWSRELWGPAGGLVSLTLYCLSPTMLAHARLVTTDLWAAAGIALPLWAFWRLTRRPTVPRAALLAASCGVAALTKFSALLVGPLLCVGAALWLLTPDGPPRRRRLAIAGGAGAAGVAATWLMVWAAYGFRFAASPDPALALDWSVVHNLSERTRGLIDAALERRLLPESYLYGLAYALGGAARRVAFLDGEITVTGWWWYFPRVIMLKTPPAVLALVGWSVAFATLRWRRFGATLPLVAAALYLGISMAVDLNIGHRHLTPLEPLLFVVAGVLPAACRGRAARLVLATLLAGAALSFALATPRYLSYVNVFGGGSAGGWRHLLDSNVDWGQDLDRLRRLCARRGIERIDLAYFGTADPEAWGLRYRRVLMVHDFRPDRPVVRPEPGRLVAVSVNLLQGLYVDRDREVAEVLVRRGWLSRRQVDRWLALRDRRSAAGTRHPPLEVWAVDEGLIDEAQRASAVGGTLARWFERLRDEGEIVGRAGDSILLMRVPATTPVSP